MQNDQAMKFFHNPHKVMQIRSNIVHNLSVIQFDQKMTVNAVLERQLVEIQKQLIDKSCRDRNCAKLKHDSRLRKETARTQRSILIHSSSRATSNLFVNKKFH